MTPADDPMAPEALLRHGGFVRAIARQLLADESLADDVAQETWLAALESPPRSAAALTSWLGRVARRLALRKNRGGARRRRREELGAREEGLPSVVDELGREGVLRQVTEAVLALDEPYRSTVFARYYQDKAPMQIAAELGCPVSTVESRLRRATLQLRERLDRDQGREMWCAGLLSLVAEPSIARRASRLVGTTTTATGTLLMSTQLKLAGAGALALVGVLALWQSSGEDPLTKSPTGIQAEIAAGDLSRRAAPAVQESGGRAPVQLDLPPARQTLPAPETPAAFGELLLRVTYSDGTPGADRGVSFMPWDSGDPWAQRSEHRTDVHGELSLSGLSPGKHYLKLDLANGGFVDVLADDVTEVHRVVPAGVHVTGRVLDPAGAPVAGAQVWLSDYGVDTSGFVVAESEGDGSFRVNDVPPRRRIGARARGFGPAHLRQVLGNVGETLELELRLADGGAEIHGVVSDSAGNPLPEALITYLPENSQQRTGARGEADMGSPPSETRSDVQGGFALTGLPEGAGQFYVRLPEWAPWTESLQLLKGDVLRKPIVLQAAGVVHGVVTNAEGRPVPGASLRCGGYGDPDFSMVHTDGEGRFRMGNLPLGSVELLASDDSDGQARTERQLLPGNPVEWSPQLSRGLTLRGRAQDTHGAPLVGWYVEVAGMRPPPGERVYWLEQRKTDGDGRFEITGCPEYALRAKLIRPPYSNNAEQSRSNFHAYDGDLEFVVDMDTLPSAVVVGQVQTHGGEPVVGSVQLVRVGGERFYEEQQLRGGRFRFSRLHAGRYSLRVGPANAPGYPIGIVDLEQGEEEDLGTVRLPVPGGLVLRSSHPAAFATVSIRPTEEAMAARLRPATITDPVGQELTLWPATYDLQLLGEETAPVQLEVVIEPGKTREVQIEPVPGVRCHLRCALPEGAADVPFLNLQVLQAGRGVAHWLLLNPVEVEYSRSVLLEPGEYLVRANAMGQYRGEAHLTVTPGNEPTVHIQLAD